MKKKIIALLLLIMLSTSLIYSEDTSTFIDYEPYTITEFPSWSWKLRRGESLFFGSLALTLPVSVIAYNLAVNSQLIDNSSTDSLTSFKYQISIAAILSLSIAIGDYIIGEIQ